MNGKNDGRLLCDLAKMLGIYHERFVRLFKRRFSV